MTFDMYGERAAEAMALIREFAKTEYYHYFQGTPELALDAFCAMMDATSCKERVLLGAAHERTISALTDGFATERAALLARIGEAERLRQITIDIDAAQRKIDAVQTAYEHVGFVELAKSISEHRTIIDVVREGVVKFEPELIARLLGDKHRVSLRLYVRCEPAAPSGTEGEGNHG